MQTEVMNNVEVKQAHSITDKTVFLRVKFGVIGNSKQVKAGMSVSDAGISEGLTLNTDADNTLLRVAKTLLESPELDAIKKSDAKLRQFLYGQCLPYDMGVQLLPIGLLESVDNTLKAYKEERSALVDNFVAVYPDLCKIAAERLGSLYNASDYQDVMAIRDKFKFDWGYISFAVPEHLKKLGLFADEAKKAEAKLTEAAGEITLLMRQTLLDMVSHLQNALTPSEDGKQKRIFASSITNISEFLNSFQFRNITDDTELDSIVEKAKSLLSGVDVESLRKDEGFKNTVKENMAGLATQLTGLVEKVPTRKFKEIE